MSEQPLAISKINDYIFCPASIYFHSLENETDNIIIQDEFQLNGTAKHNKVDNGGYSSRKDILQGISIYSNKFNLYGKIDTFDNQKGILTERKKKIKTVYDGYVFQLYAQYYSLIEMGYTIKSLRLYSMDDNKVYPILLPEQDTAMTKKFQQTLNDMNIFNFDNFKQDNEQKCSRCIYEVLCSYSALKKGDQSAQ